MTFILGATVMNVEADVGMDSGLAVFMTWPDDEYDVGSQLNVTIHVYVEGEPFDPDIINLTVLYVEREMNVTKTAVGTYESVFTIHEDMVDYGHISFTVVVEHDSMSVSGEAVDWGYIEIPTDDFEIFLTLPDSEDSYSLPGQTIELGLETTYGGKLVDANPGSVNIVVSDSVSKTEESISMERVAIGEYEASFIIPSNWISSVEYDFIASASLTIGSKEYHDSSSHFTKVTFFDVWHHIIDVGPTSAEIEYYVLDRDLQPVSGADITLYYSYEDSSMETYSDVLTSTTDEYGKAPFTLVYNNIGDHTVYVSCDVEVVYGGLTEVITDGIAITDRSLWMENGLFVRMPGNGRIKADDDISLAMRTTMYGEPYVDQDVIVYILGNDRVYFNNTVTTDVEGVLTVQFHTPALSQGYYPYLELDLYFHTTYQGSWESYEDALLVTGFGDISRLMDYVDPGTSIDFGLFDWGVPVEVILESDDASGDEEAYGMWGIGPLENWLFWNEMTMEEWVAVTVKETSNFRFFDLEWSDGAYRGTMVIPQFLSDISPISVIGLVGLADYYDARVAILEDVSTLPINQSPSLEIVTMVAGERFSGIVEVSGTADDDLIVDHVEYRIDGETWKEANGTTTWSIELNTTTLSPGNHSLEVRAFDGMVYSTNVDVMFEADQPPTVNIAGTHSDGKAYKDVVEFTGKAFDDVGVKKVEVRLDNGSWVEATLKDSDWTISIPRKNHGMGKHTLEVRADDGNQFSEVISTTFIFEEKEEEPGFVSVLAGLAILFVVLIMVRWKTWSSDSTFKISGPGGGSQ